MLLPLTLFCFFESISPFFVFETFFCWCFCQPVPKGSLNQSVMSQFSDRNYILTPRKGRLNRLPSCSHQRVFELKIPSKTLHKGYHVKISVFFVITLMHRPLETSRIGLLVIKTVCCFHHSNLTHSVRLNGMRLMLLVVLINCLPSPHFGS